MNYGDVLLVIGACVDLKKKNKILVSSRKA